MNIAVKLILHWHFEMFPTSTPPPQIIHIVKLSTLRNLALIVTFALLVAIKKNCGFISLVIVCVFIANTIGCLDTVFTAHP